MNTHKIKNSLLLLLTATIWGAAFVAQSDGMNYIEPFTFNGIRSIMGGIVLLPVIAVMNALKKKGSVIVPAPESKKQLVTGGALCGIALFLASSFQQFGILYTTVGKAGFLTACYILIVPVLGLFLGKKCRFNIVIAVVLALIGLYLLCVSGGFSLNSSETFGDILMMICAVLFSVHILIIDRFAGKADGVKMSCIQFFVCGILSVIFMFIFEQPDPANILKAWLPLCYAGIMSCGVAYTLQLIGQKGLNPTVASLIMSLESAVAAIAGWILLGQSLSFQEICGCVLMFSAIIISQLPAVNLKKSQ